MVQFNERATPLQTFTNDLALLEAAIRTTEASGPTALHNALYVALKDLTKDKKAAELRRRAIVLLSDGEDTASLVTDEQVLELAKKSEINIYAISLRPQRAPGPPAPGLQPGRVPGERAHARDRRPRLLPDLDRRARLRLRADRRGAAHALQRRLRLVERPGATASGGGSSCACPTARGCSPPQARLLRADGDGSSEAEPEADAHARARAE